MTSYDNLLQNFDEFKTIFEKASHRPFTSVDLIQVFQPGLPTFSDCLRGQRKPTAPYNGCIGKVLFRKLPYINMEALYVFSINADGSVTCSESTKTVVNQPKEKWIRLISRWVLSGSPQMRQIQRTETLKCELISVVHKRFRQMFYCD